MHRLAPLFILSTAGLLTACGGGGGSSTTPPAGGQSIGSNSLTGRFIDGPVSGLRYSTPSSTGRTDDEGEFTYRQGETVSFFIGDILVGQAPGAAVITPFSLAGVTPPTATLDIVKTVRLVNTRRNFSNSAATPLETAANIAAFLQTVDNDGDPANGIQIPAALDGATAGKSINFRQTFGRFQTDANVQSLLAAGRSAGLWGGTRTLKDPFLALDALYSGLGITPTIKRVSSFVSDKGGDGSVEATFTKTYDTQGHVTSEDTTDASGKLVAQIKWTYDPKSGRKLGEQRDGNGDGIPDQVSTFVYDSNGLLTRVENSKSVGGPVDNAVNITYDDAAGKAGKIAKVETVDASGKALARTEFTYTNGNLTRQAEDANADGTIDNIATSTYDDSGHLIMTSFDRGANGSSDESAAYTYDENDNVVTQAHTNAGQASLNVNYKYDDNANPATTQFLHPAAPTTDFTYTYEYNADGTLKTWTRTLANGSVDFKRNYNYEGTNTWASAGWVQ